MISRVTLFSLLLGLMLGLGIWMGTSGHRDACSAYSGGEKPAQSSEYVASGSQMIAVPCNDWFMRQSFHVQMLCLVELCLAAIFVLNALGDLRDWQVARKRIRGLL